MHGVAGPETYPTCTNQRACMHRRRGVRASLPAAGVGRVSLRDHRQITTGSFGELQQGEGLEHIASRHGRAESFALGPENQAQSRTRPRAALIWPRRTLLSTRCRREDAVGRVARRGRGVAATLATNARKRASASVRFFSRLRYCCALITITPSPVTRWSRLRSRRTLSSSGTDEARTSNRR